MILTVVRGKKPPIPQALNPEYLRTLLTVVHPPPFPSVPQLQEHSQVRETCYYNRDNRGMGLCDGWDETLVRITSVMST